MKEWIQHLKNEKVGNILENEPLSKHTSWKIGGPTDVLIEPENTENLRKAIATLKSFSVPWKVIGKGSNLLVLDKGFRGAIISLNQKPFQRIIFDGTNIFAGSNASLIRLANLAAKHGLTGLEFAGGIPGTVGGAVYMNAGAHGSDISKILDSAEILNQNGEIVNWFNHDFEFSYRTSKLQKEMGILISSSFKLKDGDRKNIAENMAKFKDRRRKTQPYDLPSSGSVFRNPEGDYAGRLIEELGLKGFSIGGAQISTLHSNFIVNIGSATAKDVLTLIDYIKEKVYQSYDIELLTEVETIGEG